ncbi:hypothetical protein [unidentified bacterial endosymbiont]|uniref:hypothetical protein n=1 Tax=unidentified bacterial endosymbiont TaxID=2355 RepID=UPI00209EC32E|nr:hypothetical protein [unidentified bacterial endosymbiont]
MKKILVFIFVSLSFISAAAYACTQAGGNSTQCEKICSKFSNLTDGSYGACMFGSTK